MHRCHDDGTNARECECVTLAKSVFPVPGGPYMRMFRYSPRFCRVFLVAMAMSRTRSSRDGCRETGRDTRFSLRTCSLTGSELCANTHAEHDSLQRVLRFTLQTLCHLKHTNTLAPQHTSLPVCAGRAHPTHSCHTLIGCLRASPTVIREVSRTNEGFPSRASM